mgnify:FL=1
MIILTEKQWAKIHTLIAQEFPPSYLLIREVQRRELGFTPRRHSYYDTVSYRWIEEICLDFYDEGKETWFRLKYL